MSEPARPLSSSRRLRVLHVVTGLSLGGAETLLFGLVTRAGHIDHRVICLGGRNWYSGLLEERGIPVDHLGIDSVASAPGGLLRLRRAMRRARPDIVQAWMYRANVLAGIAARSLGIPVVWGIHAATIVQLRTPSRLLARFGGAIAPWAADFVVNCSSRSVEPHRRVGYGRVPGAVIPNGYDPEAFRPDEAAGAAMRAQLGISDDTFLIGAVARWDPLKDIPNLLAAVAIAGRAGVPLKCLTIGGGLGPDDPEMEAAVAAAGAAPWVVRLGRRADVQDLARAMDLHLLASRSEAFPNVVSETMLCATPNAATDVGDTGLIVGDTGWIVPPRDPERLADAIRAAWEEWSRRPEEWRRRREAARRRIVERFTLDRMAARYEEVWRQLAHRASETPAP